MRRLLLGVAACLAFLISAQPSAFAGWGADTDAESGGVVLSASKYIQAGGEAEQQPSGRSGSHTVYSVVPYAVCDVTETGGPLCHPGRNTAICTGKHPADDTHNHWRAYNVYRSNDAGTTWDLNPTLICLNTAVIDPAPPPITPTLVHDHALALLPAPTLTLQPAATALLGVPVIATTPTTTANPEPITLLGHTIHVRAHADTYHFDFGDGTTQTSPNPGHPYTTTTPCTPDNCHAYIHHTYLHPGHYPTTLTTTWHAQYQIDNGPWHDIPNTLDTTSTTHTLTIIQTTTALITGS